MADRKQSILKVNGTVQPPRKNGFDQSNWFCKLYCLHAFEFMRRNYQKNFDLSAIDPACKSDKCDRLADKLRPNWHKQLLKRKHGGKPSLLCALWSTFGLTIVCMDTICFFIYGFLRMAMPMVLGLIIDYSNKYRMQITFQQEMGNTTMQANGTKLANVTDCTDEWLGVSCFHNLIIFASTLCALALLNVAVSVPYIMIGSRLGYRTRVAVTRLIFEKAVKISNSALQRVTIGTIVNHISNDANRFDMCFLFLNFAYLAPFMTIVAMAILYMYLGRAALGCLALALVYIPFQSILANVLSKFRSQSIDRTDKRLRLMAEILPAMKVVKMYAWEIPFSKLVHMARKMEINKIRSAMVLKSLNLGIFFVSDKVMTFVCLIIHIIDGGDLNATKVFVSLAIIYQIKEDLTFTFPIAISNAVETWLSLKRIEKFLLEDEIEEKDPRLLPAPGGPVNERACISLKNLVVRSELDNTLILNDISFDVEPGKLTVIIGPVGSGKSAILLSILKELHATSGSVSVDGSLIYASQEAWIFSGSVRENILFGKDFNPKRYHKVVKVAALEDDFKQFPEGDSTMIDDRGTSLSGGQRARISLARALYTDSDCVLLDDPLSAVDALVAKHIFEKCIKKYLRNKCVILVTHQLQFVEAADQIVVLKNGESIACGSYTNLLNKGIDLFKYSAQESVAENEESRGEPSVNRRQRDDSNTSDILRPRAISVFYDSDADSTVTYEQDEDMDMDMATTKNLEGDKTTSDKKASFKLYVKYFRMGASFLLIISFLLSNIITQVLFTGIDYWLSEWTNYKENLNIKQKDPEYNFTTSPFIHDGGADNTMNILIYSSLVVLLFCLAIFRTVSFFITCMSSSVNLHNQIFSSLIRAPLAFFDKTPIGVIMNRVSRDLGIIDDILPPVAFEAIEIMCSSFAVFILCAILNSNLLIPFALLAVLLYLNTKFYAQTARHLKRLEATARSPVFNQMACTLIGLPTIRAYGAEKKIIDRFSETQDVHSSTLFTFLSCGRFFGTSMEVMCIVFICSLTISLLLDLDSYTGSVIGLTISQALSLTGYFNWGVRQSCEVQNCMTSVERVIEFGNLEQEPLEQSKQEPPENWPTHGHLVFDNVSLHYAGVAQPTLKALTFTIHGSEKIGIVGRTGAGKSSIITTLFRLIPPSGSIRIDGMEIGNISLSRLRRSLAIIPQEPVLFSGDIRRNLDPFGEKKDDELWLALEKVQLKAKILTLPAQLDSPVSESGSDFSVGQKQLICLARAILRKNKILILDEATANVDPRTDSLIQQTIRVEFAQCTVITIAHRLNTIIDYDRIMVLDSGYLRQFDTPHNLIKQKKGIFYELFSQLNTDMKEELLRLIQKQLDHDQDGLEADVEDVNGASDAGDEPLDITYID